MKIRLWLEEEKCIMFEIIKSFTQIEKDVKIETNHGAVYYIKNSNYDRVFEEAEKYGFLRNVARTLYDG